MGVVRAVQIDIGPDGVHRQSGSYTGDGIPEKVPEGRYFVDVTDRPWLMDAAEGGAIYDPKTDTFTPPPVVVPAPGVDPVKELARLLEARGVLSAQDVATLDGSR